MKTKILLTTTILITLFTSCNLFKKTPAATKQSQSIENTATTDPGVIINGVRWATRNVDDPGTFALTPESAGKFYQWNRKKAWNIIDNEANGWNSSIPEGTEWDKSNNPCPNGWRVPTYEEIKLLLNSEKVAGEWTNRKGIDGYQFTDKATGASVFLPAVGYCYNGSGSLHGAVSIGYYWSSAPYGESGAYQLYFGNDYADRKYIDRRNALSVRCVAE